MEKEIEITEKILSEGRDNFLSVNDLGMFIATLISYRSKDPNTQVGACIIDTDENVLSIGYNKPPKNWCGTNFPWGRDVDKLGIEKTKYPYTIHAEANALNNYQGPKDKLNDSTMYVTLFPCSECAKKIVESGIKRVIYKDDKYNNTKDNACAKILLRYCGVEVIDIKELTNNTNYDINYQKKKKRNGGF